MGTGTEVGKTWVATGLTAGLRARGLTVVPRKPAQSFDAGTPAAGTDAGRLAAAAGCAPEEVCPPWRWYEVAMAPPMAADALGRPPFTLADLERELRWPARSPGSRPTVGVLEIAGGVRSPQAADGDAVDLVARLRPDDVVVVADAGLGTDQRGAPERRRPGGACCSLSRGPRRGAQSIPRQGPPAPSEPVVALGSLRPRGVVGARSRAGPGGPSAHSLEVISPWDGQRAVQPDGLTRTDMRWPQTGQYRGGSMSGRQPRHRSTGRPHPTQWLTSGAPAMGHLKRPTSARRSAFSGRGASAGPRRVSDRVSSSSCRR